MNKIYIINNRLVEKGDIVTVFFTFTRAFMQNFQCFITLPK